MSGFVTEPVMEIKGILEDQRLIQRFTGFISKDITMSSTPHLRLFIRGSTDESPADIEDTNCLLDKEKKKVPEERTAEPPPIESAPENREQKAEMSDGATKVEGPQALRLKRELDRVKTKLTLEEKNRINEKAQNEKIIRDLRYKCSVLQKQFEAEKVLQAKRHHRTAREKEKFPDTNDCKMKLTINDMFEMELKNLYDPKQNLKQVRDRPLRPALCHRQQHMQPSVIQVDVTLPDMTKSLNVQNGVKALPQEVEEQPKTPDQLSIQEADLTVSTLKLQVANLQEENSSLMKNVQATEQKIMDLQSTVATLKNRMAHQETLCDTAIAEKDDLRCKLADAQENIRQKNETINIQNENLRRQEKGFQTMTSELSNFKSIVAELKQLLHHKTIVALQDEKENAMKELDHYKKLTMQQLSMVTTLQLKLTDCYQALNATGLEQQNSQYGRDNTYPF